MNTCSHTVMVGDQINFDYVECGQPLQGRGPCATCGHPDWRDAHRFKLDVIARHAYVPSEYVCEAGHVSTFAVHS